MIATRPFVPHSHVGARLRSLLAACDENVSDVVLLAATSEIDNVEPALLRTGGFDEQIGLAAPASDNVVRVVEQWLANKQVQLVRDLHVQDLAAHMTDCTFGEIDGMLQRALNRAIQRTPNGELVTLSREDLGMATQGHATPARRGRAHA